MLDINFPLLISVLLYWIAVLVVGIVVLPRPSLLRRSWMARGAATMLVVWGMIGFLTWKWGGLPQGFLRYDPRYAGYFRLIEAIDAGDTQAVEQELKHTSPDIRPPFEDAEDYCVPLVQAVQANNQAMVRLLLQHGADPNREDVFKGCPLVYAADADNVPVMKILLTPDTTRQENKDRALWYAASSGKARAVAFLLAHGANADQTSEEGDKPKGGGEPLSKMVGDQGYPEIARLLEAASRKGKR